MKSDLPDSHAEARQFLCYCKAVQTYIIMELSGVFLHLVVVSNVGADSYRS